MIKYKNYTLTRNFKDGHDYALTIHDANGSNYRALFRPISNLEQAKKYVDELIAEVA